MKAKPQTGWIILLGAAFLVAAGGLWVLLPGWLDPYHLRGGEWALYRKNFIRPDGRVVDDGNGMISHSEGQGFAMIIATGYRDRQTFDRLWNWTRTNLQTRPADKLLSWLWKPNDQGGGAVADPNNASDGDILVAWALQRAHELWGDYRYQQAAAQILVDLVRLNIKTTDQGPVLLPGTDGFVKDGVITLNPSYYVFPAFAVFSRAYPAGPWKDLSAAGRAMVGHARFGEWKLAPDWLTDGSPSAISPDFPPVFGYNAVRIPLYLAWENPRTNLTQPFAEFWRSFSNPEKIPATVDLVTNTFGPDPALPGMRAIASFTLACFQKQNLTPKALPVLTKEESYYSASLNLLTKIAIRETFTSGLKA